MLRTLIELLVCAAASFAHAAEPQTAFHAVECGGTYPHHLQGVCVDGREAIFWCFTTRLVKTDASGKVLKQIDVGNHHGDLCFREGRIHVAVNFGKFNDPQGNADSWVYVYDADDLTLLARHPVPEVVYGAGGIAFHAGKFLVVGGLPPGNSANTAYKYDSDFKFVKSHRLETGYTLMGIQTAAFADGNWWFGCYGDPKILLKAEESLTAKGQRFEFDASLGIVPVTSGTFLVARGGVTADKQHTGRLVPAMPDEKQGLKLADLPAANL